MKNALPNISKTLSLLLLLYISAFTNPVGVRAQATMDAKTGNPVSFVKHPEWAKNANIYEVNIRQYTPEGTFNAFARDLPRLKKMGVDIIWLMPIQTIGEKNRKGPLGSPYSVKNYKKINPHYGTMDDLKNLVNKVHQQGMKIIIDWVANHTAWDNIWTKTHPEWYTKDANGHFKPPVADWSDVIELDYSNQHMRDAMLDAMKYWVQKADIDGFRCDVAGSVPTDFWNRVRRELDRIKPVFMLAEAEKPELHNYAFDMTYAWEFHGLTNQIAHGEIGINALDDYRAKEDSVLAPNAYRMYFTSNHDENTWNGSAVERYGDGVKTFAILAATFDGMPLIYDGQESHMSKRLEFFKKDPIQWNDYSMQGFYHTLLELKHKNPALWNGAAGGSFSKVVTSDHEKNVYAYTRKKDDHEVMVVLNFSKNPEEVKLLNVNARDFKNVFTGETEKVGKASIKLAPWGYKVWAK